MPFCDIDAGLSLNYVTNTPSGDVTDLDHSKSTILFLPSIFGSVTIWLREQFSDRRLSHQYNLIAFDQRNMGASKGPSFPERDTWVDAADLAVAHERLQLPPCHIFGITMNSGASVMKFAALFPDKCLSVCVCSPPVQGGEDPEWLQQGYAEFTEAYCFPTDLDDLQRAHMEFSWFAFANQVTPDLEDEIIAWWQMNMPPTNRSSFYAQAICAMQRPPFSDEELKAIQQPTIFITGDKSLLSPPEKAQELCIRMPNCQTFVIKGGPQLFHVLPEYASVLNRVYCQFLAPLCITNPPEPILKQPDPYGVCKTGLARLAELKGDPLIATRDPSNPLSFSCLSPETVAENAVQVAHFAKGESEAFSGLDEHGYPLRRFSERHIDEWKPAAFQRFQKQLMASEHNYVSVVRTSSIHTEEPNDQSE